MKKYIKDDGVEIRAIDLCVLDRRQPVRFRDASDHARHYACLDVFFLFLEWSTKRMFYATYRVNPLDMTVKATRIARLKEEDRKKLAVAHTHKCASISAALPIKHYPRWGYNDPSLQSIEAEEIGIELKLDFSIPSQLEPSGVFEHVELYLRRLGVGSLERSDEDPAPDNI